jgi:hypothetical protein
MGAANEETSRYVWNLVAATRAKAGYLPID